MSIGAPEPASPDVTGLTELVERLASFDLDAIVRRLDALEQRSAPASAPPAGDSLHDAIAPLFEQFGAGLRELVEAVKQLVGAAPSSPAPASPPPEPAPQPTPQPAARAGGGLLDSLFRVPTIPPQ